MPTDQPAEVLMRRAAETDLAEIAEVHYEARRAAFPAMPAAVHPIDEMREWVGGWDLSADEVWVAEEAGRLLGYARFTPTWLDDLYVRPEHQGRGVGSGLFDLVTGQRPDGFCLWVFESNEPARAFYRSRGCVELERTDGAANEERSPDIRMAWPGGAPLDFFRRLIDETDLLLGDVLARRTALTRAVQQVKADTGLDPTRDPEREADIVQRVAAVVPELGEERVAGIVEAIITASLDTISLDTISLDTAAQDTAR